MVPDDIFDYFGLSGFTADQLRAKGYIVWTPPRSKANSSLKATLSPTWLFDNGLLGYKDGTFGGWAETASNTTRQGNGTAASPPALGPNFARRAERVRGPHEVVGDSKARRR